MDLRVIQLTDIHYFTDPAKTLLNINTNQSFKLVLEAAQANGWPPDFLIATGDLSQEGNASSYKRLLETLSGIGLPIYCLPGNHDNPAVMSQVLSSDEVHVEKNLVKENWNIVFLNTAVKGTNDGRFSEDELAYLDENLKNHPNHHALICFHHSPVSVGSAWLDQMQISNSDDFFRLIDRYPQVRGVLFGHIHQQFDETRAGVKLMAAPSCGLQFKPHSDAFRADTVAPGYRWLTLGPNGEITTGIKRIKNSPFKPDLSSKGY
jgi:Icc protein